MTDELDPYAVLQVSADADQAVIAAAYRTLARRHHPDVAADPDAGTRMARINAAWTILRDPARRRAYDLGRPNRGNGAHGKVAHADGGHAGGASGAATGSAGTSRAAQAPHGGAWNGGANGGRSPAGAGAGRFGAGETRDRWQSRSGTFRGHASGWRTGPNGEGAAGPPPGPRSGSVLAFGRHIGWSIGEIARYDPGYLEWLEQRPEGSRYREEIDRTLRASGFRKPPNPVAAAAGHRRWRR